MRDRYHHSFANGERLIHIFDLDPATCESLSVFFRLEGFQTTFSPNLANFFPDLERRRPDVVFINADLGVDDGLQVLRRVRSVRPGLPVFMLSNEPQVSLAVQAMKAGAVDVVTKPIDTEYLLRSVREVMRQERPNGAEIGARRLLEVRGFSQLTPREREVLLLVTSGQSNKEAGRELGISPRTIEVHRARVMEKLGARNTADLMRIVLAG